MNEGAREREIKSCAILGYQPTNMASSSFSNLEVANVMDLPVAVDPCGFNISVCHRSARKQTDT